MLHLMHADYWTKESINSSIKERYPIGTRVEVVKMYGRCANMPSGLQGTVKRVNDIGTIFVDWDTGITLGILYEIGSLRVVNNTK